MWNLNSNFNIFASFNLQLCVTPPNDNFWWSSTKMVFFCRVQYFCHVLFSTLGPAKKIFFFVVLKLQYFCHFFLQFWAPPKTRIFGAALISITFVVLIFKSFVMKEERGLKVTTKIRKPHLIQNPICMIFP